MSLCTATQLGDHGRCCDTSRKFATPCAPARGGRASGFTILPTSDLTSTCSCAHAGARHFRRFCVLLRESSLERSLGPEGAAPFGVAPSGARSLGRASSPG